MTARRRMRRKLAQLEQRQNPPPEESDVPPEPNGYRLWLADQRRPPTT